MGYIKKNYKVFDVLVNSQNEIVSDSNFQLPANIERVTGFRLQSSYPERLRYAGTFGLKVDNLNIINAGTFANLASPYDDSFFDLKEMSEDKTGLVAGSRTFSLTYQDRFDAGYAPAPFVNYIVSVMIEFTEKIN